MHFTICRIPIIGHIVPPVQVLWTDCRGNGGGPDDLGGAPLGDGTPSKGENAVALNFPLIPVYLVYMG